MSPARKLVEQTTVPAHPVLSMRIDIAQLLAAVHRHVMLTPTAERAIAAEFAALLLTPRIHVRASARPRSRHARHRPQAPIDAAMSKWA